MARALLLNASHEPLAIIRDRDAVELYMERLADPVEYSGKEFHSPSITVAVPSVLALRKYVVMPAGHRSIMPNSRNVRARDRHICAYCGNHADTIDHIVPKALGGKTSWENVVAACRRCNGKKGHRTLMELGWVLGHTPYRPKGVSAYLLKIQPEPAWEPYLQVA